MERRSSSGEWALFYCCVVFTRIKYMITIESFQINGAAERNILVQVEQIACGVPTEAS